MRKPERATPPLQVAHASRTARATCARCGAGSDGSPTSAMTSAMVRSRVPTSRQMEMRLGVGWAGMVQPRRQHQATVATPKRGAARSVASGGSSAERKSSVSCADRGGGPLVWSRPTAMARRRARRRRRRKILRLTTRLRAAVSPSSRVRLLAATPVSIGPSTRAMPCTISLNGTRMTCSAPRTRGITTSSPRGSRAVDRIISATVRVTLSSEFAPTATARILASGPPGSRATVRMPMTPSGGTCGTIQTAEIAISGTMSSVVRSVAQKAARVCRSLRTAPILAASVWKPIASTMTAMGRSAGEKSCHQGRDS
mmetsp:Transcript_48954/g.157326  ORF Transcript_48954/g.157326 Transcript_48954/m.157326 type:complete len:313 (+) Transcript_48954:261-1199(+)